MPKKNTRIVRQLRNGQITIPKAFRDELGLDPDGLLQLTLRNGGIRVTAISASSTAKGSPWLKELYEAFAPVRESLRGYSEKEINDAIDEAVRGARTENRRRRAKP